MKETSVWPEHPSARMADAKRQNAGGKAPIAMPSSGPAGMVSLETALAGVIGARYVFQFIFRPNTFCIFS